MKRIALVCLFLVGLVIAGLGIPTYQMRASAGGWSQYGHWDAGVSYISSVVHVQSVGRLGVDHISGAIHVAGILPTREHVAGAIRAWQVNACGTTASLAVASNAARRDLIIQNLGGPANPERIILYIGFGTTGHVALTSANGFPLGVHRSVIGAVNVPTAVATTPPLRLENYQGPIACVTSASTAIMSILEILR